MGLVPWEGDHHELFWVEPSRSTPGFSQLGKDLAANPGAKEAVVSSVPLLRGGGACSRIQLLLKKKQFCCCDCQMLV